MLEHSPSKELAFLARACQESAEDVLTLREKQQVIYNLDFGLLCPVVFKQPGKGSKNFLVPPIAATRRVLANAADASFQIVISGYTMMEIQDQLAHLRQRLRSVRPELYSSVDGLVLREQLQTSETLRQSLLQYTKRGLDGLVRKPIEDITEMLDSGAIRGIGDVVDVSQIRRYADRAQFEQFFNEHRRLRLPGERERDPVDSEFHFKIDAVNSCLTLAMAEGGAVAAYFVTPTSLNIRQCTIGNTSYARVDRTTLFVMNAQELRREGLIEDEVNHLQRMARQSLEYATELSDDKPLREASFDLKLEVSGLFYRVSQMLGRTEPVRVEAIEQEIDDITAALSNPRQMRNDLADAVAYLEDGARRLEAQASSLDLAYVREFDFSDDPVLARIRHELNLAS